MTMSLPREAKSRLSSARTLGCAATVVLLASLGVALRTADAQDEIVVTNANGNSVTVYPRTASGSTAPIRTLTGNNTQLNGPLGVAQDLVHGELVVANNFGLSVSVYALTATGNTAPLRTLTGFVFPPVQVVLDPVHDEMIVVSSAIVMVFSRTASGNATPLRTLVGSFTGLAQASGVALDLVHDELVVVNSAANSVTVFARTASGNTPPLRMIQGVNTGLNVPSGIALDLFHDEVFVTNQANSSITVYARTATGNALPLRTLQGTATKLSVPMGLTLDLVHDELVVPISTGAVATYRRGASGNTAPLRTLSGATTGLSNPEFVALSTSPPLSGAVLPLSRSHQIGTFLTAFATIINAGPGPVQQCRVAPPGTVPPGLGPFVFQTTDPATNAATGTPNTPANIPAGGQQTFVFGFTPTLPIPETSLAMNFLCENTVAAASIPGVTDLTLVTDVNPVPDTIALIATVSGDGVVRIAGSTGLQLFAIGTANVGSAGTITVSADTGGQRLPVTVTVCETDALGSCTASPVPSVTVQYEAGTTRSFAFFASANGSIVFNPAVNRVFARLIDASGTTRGSTSAAVCTTPNVGC
jgi:lactonase family protein with 7-bladed beta-propeller